MNQLDNCSQPGHHETHHSMVTINNNLAPGDDYVIGHDKDNHNDVFDDNQEIENENPSLETKSNNVNLNMYLSSLSSNPILNFDGTSSKNEHDCIVFLSDPNIINSTLGAIYNVREPSMGNWSGCIIVMGNNLIGQQFNQVFRFFNCLNVYHLDITNDPLKEEFSHVHYWKTYIMLHPFFRRNDKDKVGTKLFRYIMYLDSDCITIKPIEYLIDRTIGYITDKYKDKPELLDNIWLAWREDYRHKSMYKAVLDLKKYDNDTLNELKREYPDYVESKQGNVMLLNMEMLPSVEWFKMEIKRIMDKYSAGFWRNDQSLFNLMFYYNSSDLGWSAFTHPPSEQLFYPPDNFPMVHTGGHEAMALRRPKEKRGGIKREPEKAWYHALWEFWMHKLRLECPKLDTNS